MDSKVLARQLRVRIASKGLLPVGQLQVVPDWTVIESYAKCSQCGEVWLEGAALATVVDSAENMNEFFELLDAAIRANAIARRGICGHKLEFD